MTRKSQIKWQIDLLNPPCVHLCLFELYSMSFCFCVVKKKKVFPLLQKSSVLTRAGEQRRRCQSMKSYPSSELRNVCDEQTAVEPAEEGQDILQQMLERRSGDELWPFTSRAIITLFLLKSVDLKTTWSQTLHKMELYDSTLHVVYIVTQIFTPYSVLIVFIARSPLIIVFKVSYTKNSI